MPRLLTAGERASPANPGQKSMSNYVCFDRLWTSLMYRYYPIDRGQRANNKRCSLNAIHPGMNQWKETTSAAAILRCLLIDQEQGDGSMNRSCTVIGGKSDLIMDFDLLSLNRTLAGVTIDERTWIMDPVYPPHILRLIQCRRHHEGRMAKVSNINQQKITWIEPLDQVDNKSLQGPVKESRRISWVHDRQHRLITGTEECVPSIISASIMQVEELIFAASVRVTIAVL